MQKRRCLKTNGVLMHTLIEAVGNLRSRNQNCKNSRVRKEGAGTEPEEGEKNQGC